MKFLRHKRPAIQASRGAPDYHLGIHVGRLLAFYCDAACDSLPISPTLFQSNQHIFCQRVRVGPLTDICGVLSRRLRWLHVATALTIHSP